MADNNPPPPYYLPQLPQLTLPRGTFAEEWLNKKGMNVTKSKFASESESAGIHVDDPLFWQKVMPDFVTPKM